METVPDGEVTKDDLKKILQFGLTVQAMAAVWVFAVRKNKTDFVTEINAKMENFVNSLSEEEKQELDGDLKNMVEQKTEEFMSGLSQKLTPEQVEEVVKTLKPE